MAGEVHCPSSQPIHYQHHHHHQQQHQQQSRYALLAFYLLFGAIHEFSHVVAALIVSPHVVLSLSKSVDFFNPVFLLQVLFFRQTPLDFNINNDEDDSNCIWMIRHAGWIVSCLIALWCHTYLSPKNNQEDKMMTKKMIRFAAYMTAIEAISTDLLQLPPLLPILGSNTIDNQTLLFCGNFGIIFLHPAWYDNDHGRKVGLDLLQKMIFVTMVRGAQTGGVVTFLRRSKEHKDQLIGIRSRVVNNKRSDLSEKIRSKIEADARRAKISSTFGSGPVDLCDFPKSYFGHTRFATSSIANFGGTHPHQWTPPTLQRVFHINSTSATPTAVLWENFITHNGDLDFFTLNGVTYGLDTIQQWLPFVTGAPMPSSVDSVSIAGLIDVIHTYGCFALSCRYAILCKMPDSKMSVDTGLPRLNMLDYTKMSAFFERALLDIVEKSKNSLDTIGSIPEERDFFVGVVQAVVQHEMANPSSPTFEKFAQYLMESGTEKELAGDDLSNSSSNMEGAEVDNVEQGNFTNIRHFCKATIDAFFDNDLLNTTKTFLANAKGSFGVGVTSSMTAHRQVCFASRGQTMSVAFYPKKGVILYGSEQAATRAGLSYPTPGGDLDVDSHAEKAIRLDLDDLNGEVLLLDWGTDGEAQISPPNRHWPAYRLMNGKVTVVLIPDGQSKVSWHSLHQRMTLLEGHEFVKPLPPDADDPVLNDLRDIPRICRTIQDDWRGFAINDGESVSLNRVTAWNLTRRIKKRLEVIASGSLERSPRSIDLVLTGCEVSLWVAEQFASDLQKAFPRLGIKAISSNKLLGLFGQDLSVPALGYPMSERSHDMKEAIMIIVSHSGGTFAPLACSNLLKSFSENLFVVTSEWDTQVAKQLRSLHTEKDHLLNSRIFSTGVGFRTAEPSSISVAATHQLLTNIFEHLCITILSTPSFRRASGAIITERDVQELERCNQDNITALEDIVGVDSDGNILEDDDDDDPLAERELRAVGDVWAEHILEGARAYIMAGIYVFVTVTTGFPIARAIATGVGLDLDSPLTYLVGFLDACIFFFFPQIAILGIRWYQGRAIRHRMVGRTVVVADIPWVSQAVDSFASKLFACSYSIAGLNVLSANPADHLVHRHTHRVVRGSLLLCGRPDGRLSALTSLETSTCLAVNQACSIQSLGGTCESVTIGHNPFKLPLSARAVFLKRHRPVYLCERVLGEIEAEEKAEQRRAEKERAQQMDGSGVGDMALPASIRDLATQVSISNISAKNLASDNMDSPKPIKRGLSGAKIGASSKGLNAKKIADERKKAAARNKSSSKSAAALQGAYLSLAKETTRGDSQSKKTDYGVQDDHKEETVEDVLETMIEERKNKRNLREIYKSMDKSGTGHVEMEEFVSSYKVGLEDEQLRKLFMEFDGGKGYITFDDFVQIAELPEMGIIGALQTVNRTRDLLLVDPSTENYFGETLRNDAPPGMSVFSLEKSQRFSMELYETRVASLQRFVAMAILFHQTGKRVEQFFPRYSFGLMGYRMDRSHSITRIQTTASPVSGAEVRERIKQLELQSTIIKSVEMISFAWQRYKQNKLVKQANLVKERTD